ncbi:MAG: dihydrodipicolinate synthase family protein [Steroidobacteraceae bacterium]
MPRRERLTAADVRGAWAIIPTPAKDNASDWRATDTVDHDEAARAVEGLIAAGVDGILSLGTLGECATLRWEEKRAFIATMVEAARGRVPVFAGTSTLSTRETVEQTRIARDIGADGTMLGPPMWNKPDVGTSVQFFRDVAEAVPEMAICVYANPFVFKFEYPAPFWAQVAAIPQVVSAKTAGAGTYLRDLGASRGRIRLMPIDAEYYAAARLDPESAVAFWSSSASCGPAPVIALRDLVAEAKRSGDWTAAKALTDRIGLAILPTIANGDFNEFQIHNIALEKGRMDVAGWMRAGPNRPPHHVVPDRIREFGRLGGEAWAALQRDYASHVPSRKGAG